MKREEDLTEELAAYLERYRKEIEESAYELLGQRMPELTEALFGLFEETGNRLQYEAVYFARRKFLAVLGMWTLVDEGETVSALRPRVYAKLSAVIREICGEECWALPAHVDRGGNPDWRVTVDLFAAETAQTLAELTDRAGDLLEPGVCSLAREQIERRVLKPFLTSQEPYSGWERAGNNWNAVCSGAIGSACLHLLREDAPRLEKAVERICRALAHYLEGFPEDGACAEGIGYYFYGMTYFVNFAQELYEATEGKKDLFRGFLGKREELDKLLEIAAFPAKCFFPDGKSVSFSDGSCDETFRVGVMSTLALHYAGESGEKASGTESGAEESGAKGRGTEARGRLDGRGVWKFFPSMERAAGLHTDSCYRFAALKLDWVSGKKLLEVCAGGTLPAWREKGFVHVLPQTQWLIAGAGTGVGFACKGGHNDEPHNHNDIGHFLYEAEGEMFFTDLGAGEYTKDYFGGGRYGILCNSALGHSVPILDGQLQSAGRQYHCGAFQVDAEVPLVRMELKSAYSEGLLEGFSRELRFDRESGRLAVRDRGKFTRLRRAESGGGVVPGAPVSGASGAETQTSALRAPASETSGAGTEAVPASDSVPCPGRVTENLVTQIAPRIEGNRVRLDGEKGSCVLEVVQADVRFRIREYEYFNHQGQAETVYGIQWEVPENAGSWDCAFSVCFNGKP